MAALQKLCAKTGGQVMADFYSSASPEEEKARIKATLFNASAHVLAGGKSYLVYVTPEFLIRNTTIVKKLVSEKVCFCSFQFFALTP